MRDKCYVCDSKDENLVIATIHVRCLRQIRDRIKKLEQPEVCGYCKFYSEEPGFHGVHVLDGCRKNAPGPNGYASVDKECWCGDFERRGCSAKVKIDNADKAQGHLYRMK